MQRNGRNGVKVRISGSRPQWLLTCQLGSNLWNKCAFYNIWLCDVLIFHKPGNISNKLTA